MAQGFLVDLFNNTQDLMVITFSTDPNVSGGPPNPITVGGQQTLSVVGGGPAYFQVSGDTGAVTVEVDVGPGPQPLARLEFDTAALTNFPNGSVFFGSRGDLPGVSLDHSTNLLFPLLYLGVDTKDSERWTIGTVVVVEASGATNLS